MTAWLQAIETHSIDRRQFVDFRQSTLPDGQRIIEAYNSSGLAFTLLPDRGMDIWQASYKGTPLTWISQGSPHRADGEQDWLRQFNGGLLTTCGLTHVGPPETAPETGERRGIHGRYTFQAAHQICTRHDADETTLSCEVTQSRLFGEQLTLSRSVSLSLGVPEIRLTDEVTNHGDISTPLMLLYHCNVGYPLVRAGSELVVNSHVHPRDEEARAGYENWSHYESASPGYAEKVFFHHVRHVDGQAHALLTNGEIGLEMTWQTDNLPYLTQWKNTRQGIYVCGVEPGNCIPEGQNKARQAGRLVTLAPGETHTFRLRLQIIEGQHTLLARRDAIEGKAGTLIPNCNLEND